MKELLTNSTFYLSSDLCSAAVSTAKLLDQWLDCEENLHQAKAFSAELVTSLKICFNDHGNIHVRREKMGGSFTY